MIWKEGKFIPFFKKDGYPRLARTEPEHIVARPIKFGIRKNIEIELERLVHEGIISPIDPNDSYG